MTPRDAVEVCNEMRRLWPNSKQVPAALPPNATAEERAEYRIVVGNWLRLLADFDTAAILNAVFSLARSQQFAPHPSEIVQFIQSTNGTRLSWAAGWARLVAATAAYREALASGPDLDRVTWVEHEDGFEPKTDPSSTAVWKRAAGPDVTRWVNETGGIRHALEHITDQTYRAQFRNWWETTTSESQHSQDATHIARFRELTTGSALAALMPHTTPAQLPATRPE